VVAGEDPPREARDVPKLEELGSHPAGIVRIIRKATCRDPDHRYRFIDELVLDLSHYREHADVGMVHPEVDDRNTGILSVVPDAPEQPEQSAAPETEIPSKTAPKAVVLSGPMKTHRLFRAFGLAVAFAGIAFLVNDYLAVQGSLRSLTVEESEQLSSFVSEASVSKGRPPVLFAHVDESWELLSEESRLEEADALFKSAAARWGVHDGFIHRGKALVAQRWDNEITVFGSLHGDEK
jgi:hypothetical protein